MGFFAMAHHHSTLMPAFSMKTLLMQLVGRKSVAQLKLPHANGHNVNFVGQPLHYNHSVHVNKEDSVSSVPWIVQK